jgi:hypothetical protein
MAEMASLELSNSFNAFNEHNQDKAIDIAKADVLKLMLLNALLMS